MNFQASGTSFTDLTPEKIESEHNQGANAKKLEEKLTISQKKVDFSDPSQILSNLQKKINELEKRVRVIKSQKSDVDKKERGSNWRKDKEVKTKAESLLGDIDFLKYLVQGSLEPCLAQRLLRRLLPSKLFGSHKRLLSKETKIKILLHSIELLENNINSLQFSLKGKKRKKLRKTGLLKGNLSHQSVVSSLYPKTSETDVLNSDVEIKSEIKRVELRLSRPLDFSCLGDYPSKFQTGRPADSNNINKRNVEKFVQTETHQLAEMNFLSEIFKIIKHTRLCSDDLAKTCSETSWEPCSAGVSDSQLGPMRNYCKHFTSHGKRKPGIMSALSETTVVTQFLVDSSSSKEDFGGRKVENNSEKCLGLAFVPSLLVCRERKILRGNLSYFSQYVCHCYKYSVVTLVSYANTYFSSSNFKVELTEYISAEDKLEKCKPKHWKVCNMEDTNVKTLRVDYKDSENQCKGSVLLNEWGHSNELSLQKRLLGSIITCLLESKITDGNR